MFDNFPLWPARASTAAGNVDALYIFLIIVSGMMTLLVFTAIIIFAARYRHRRGVLAEQIEGSIPLEVTWSIIPLGVFMVIFVWGAVVYFHSRTPPRDSTDVYVVAKQWMWKLQHAEGQREINSLHIPVGRDVRLIMTSQDVIHSFFVPAFRMKQDVLPGRYTTAWFHATKAGTYHLFCAEYCGTQHSGMIGDIVVMEPAQYEAWMSGGNTGPLSATGEKLFAELGCATCHRSDTQGRGPNLQGVFGKPVQLQDGRIVTADENYIRESILDPGSKIVNGFKPVMPTFQGLVSEEQVNALVAYVKSLSGASASKDEHRHCAAHRASQGKSGAMSMATPIVTPVEREDYLNKEYGVGFVASDHRPQAHRPALSDLDHVLLFHRRLLRPAHPPRVAHSRRGPGPGRHLQQALHHARPGDGLLFPDPVDPRRTGQLPHPDDDRGKRPRLPAHQPAELVSLHHRRHHDVALHPDRRRRHRLDFLHALQHRIQQYKSRRSRARHLRRRILLHPYRTELRRHHSPHARPRNDLVAPATIRLGALRHQHHPDPRNAGHRHHPRAGGCRARSRTSASSIPNSAAIPCSSSTCSGSTRIPPSTS